MLAGNKLLTIVGGEQKLLINKELWSTGEDYIDGDIPPIESGIYLPEFRLPTEAEWEYAAYGQVGDQWLDENQTQRRLYPWMEEP